MLQPPLISLRVICVTLIIYSQFHGLRTFRTALSELLLAEPGFLRRVCFFPSTSGEYHASYMELSLEGLSWEYHFPEQPAKSAIPLVPSEMMWFHFSRKDTQHDLFPERHFVIWSVN